jgi:hypothetical protein
MLYLPSNKDNMNKTEKIKHLTKSVITFVNALGYEVVNDESGRITFWNGQEGDVSKEIEYSRNGDVTISNWASPEEKQDADKLEQFIKLIKHDLAM